KVIHSNFSSIAQLCEQEWYGSQSLPSFSTVQARAELALQADGKLQDWIAFLPGRDAVWNSHVAPLVSHVETRSVAPTALEAAFDYVVHASMARGVFRKHRDLARFKGLDHEQVRARFADYDRQIVRLHRQLIAHTIDQRPVPSGNSVGPVSSFSELSL